MFINLTSPGASRWRAPSQEEQRLREARGGFPPPPPSPRSTILKGFLSPASLRRGPGWCAACEAGSRSPPRPATAWCPAPGAAALGPAPREAALINFSSFPAPSARGSGFKIDFLGSSSFANQISGMHARYLISTQRRQSVSGKRKRKGKKRKENADRICFQHP